MFALELVATFENSGLVDSGGHVLEFGFWTFGKLLLELAKVGTLLVVLLHACDRINKVLSGHKLEF